MSRSRYLWISLIALAALAIVWTLYQMGQISTGLVPSLTGNANDEVEAVLAPANEITPPVLTSARMDGAQLRISGAAMPGRSVTLNGAGANGGEGDKLSAFTNGDGHFEITVSPMPREAQLYSITMKATTERTITSDNAAVILPGGRAQVVSVRPGLASKRLFPAAQAVETNALNLSAVEYDNSGSVIFTGQSSAAGLLRVYVGETLIGEGIVAAPGNWTVTADASLPPQSYEVSFALLNEEGEELLTLASLFERRFMAEEALEAGQVLHEDLETGLYLVRRLRRGGVQHSFFFDAQSAQP